MGAAPEQPMKKAPLYSRSRRGVAAPEAPPPAAAAPATAPAGPSAAEPTRRTRARAFAVRHERTLWALALLLMAALALFWRPGAPTRAAHLRADRSSRSQVDRGEAAHVRRDARVRQGDPLGGARGGL
ncbi:hypothetical protein FSC37_12230 [Piscinibacter aquaticus]|uniref:Uncharacterized protein n=1 Tax=Piscinibacter aquaticus TaxID=392597 RepID=A0A5C6U3X9_9BURK|nr:hypothetical protein FSC37_12230 [Piscinibacter aquaticus]